MRTEEQIIDASGALCELATRTLHSTMDPHTKVDVIGRIVEMQKVLNWVVGNHCQEIEDVVTEWRKAGRPGKFAG